MTGEQRPGGLAQKIYDCPTTFDGDAIGTHLGLSMMVDQSTSTAEEQRRVVMSMCEDIASMIQAEPAEARIRSLEAELEDAKTVDSGLWDWLCERDLQPDGVEFEWSDVVVALTEHETNAYDLAEKAEARATAAEAKLARAVEGLERIVHWRVEMTGTPVDTEAANAWALTFDAAATEASQTLAALQQEGE